MANLNRIVLVGRLTGEPEVRATADGTAMAKFRLAVDRGGALEGAFQSGTDFIDIIAWQKLAEAVGAKLGKGKLALVEGRIQNRSFEDQTGQKRWVTEVVARSITALDASKVPLDVARGPTSKVSETAEEVADEELESDLPF